MLDNSPPVFRFAPSPNGALHLGHAYSALLNQAYARQVNGKFLLRIEDIDRVRCSQDLEEEMLEDLNWIGVFWDEKPVRQSENFSVYEEALHSLQEAELIYPSFLSRGEIRMIVGKKAAEGEVWPLDPDGSPHYPGSERNWSTKARKDAQEQKPLHALRLNMRAALDHAGGDMVWHELGEGPNGERGESLANPAAWGDVVLAWSGTPTSYHLSVVLDDAQQNITHVVRGRDLFHATSIHRLLQTLLGLPVPVYRHHDLVLDDAGRKLSKSAGDTSLRALRQAGLTPDDVRSLIGIEEALE